jgi:hypothetical protein
LNASSQLNDVVVVGYGASDSDKTNNYTPPKPVYILNGKIINDYEFTQIIPIQLKK